MKEVSIRPSGIPGSGLGLFAEENIKRGEPIVLITGPRYTEEEALKIDALGYLLDAADGSEESIDVEGPARYANDAAGFTRVAGTANNCAFVLYEHGEMWLEARRSIKAGQEIFVSYGRSYWTRMKQQYLETEAVATI